MHDRLRPDEEAASAMSTPSAPPAQARPRLFPPTAPLGGWFVFLGIIVPFAALAFELLTRQCAEIFFDPLPTWWHVFLVALVPVSNALVWQRLRTSSPHPGRWLPLAAAASIGICIIYSIVFLPLAPFGAVGILAYGLGLLPLSPLVALFMSLRAWRRLAPELHGIRALPGMLAGVAALLVPFGWGRATDYLLERALAGNATEQTRAVQWLRMAGSESHLLDRCYPSGRSLLGMFEGRRTQPDDVERIRAIYYRVTGVSFNEQPAPAGVALGARGRGMFNFDIALGGQRVAGKVPGLTLEKSELETSVNAADLTSYSEWKLVFRNVAANASEARAQIELPPGGVVSRLTLWINGEPREAAFGKTSQVRGAYQEVAVAQRRDPVLVTTCGPDRVLMQCFPVPANGGEMTVRFGVTAPLQVADSTNGHVSFPRMIETNFEEHGRLRTPLSLRSDAPIAGVGTELQRELVTADIERELIFPIALPGLSTRAADDPTDPQSSILQTAGKAAPETPRHVVYVIDGSRALRPHRQELSAIFARSDTQAKSVILAGDTVERWAGEGSLPAWLEAQSFAGGCDNLPALRAAWTEASQHEGSAIVWIHGAQPVALSDATSIFPAGNTSANAPAIYDVFIGSGPNHILPALEGVQWRRVAPGSSVSARLDGLWKTWSGAQPRFAIDRSRIPRSSVPAGTASGNQHISRLWAKDEVERLRKASTSGDGAAKLAVQMQLVTPVSGAVVLETKQQYERHGLEAVDPSTVPSIPEPASLLLIASSATLLALRRRRARG